MEFKEIKAFLFDVDGVMTDGGIYYDSKGNEFKKFNVKDGQICKYLKKENIILGVITGRKSEIVERRFAELNFDFIAQGISDKASVLDKFCDKFNIRPNEVCYTGDDINDLGIIKKVGLSFCPADAIISVKEEVDRVLEVKGGDGVLRAVADSYLNEKGVKY